MPHTPGPWQIRGQHDPEHPFTVAHVEGVISVSIAAVCDSDQVDANARLIVAAPELLALCEQATRIFGGHSGAPADQKTDIEVEQGYNLLDRMRAAIAKAEEEVA